MNDVTSDKLKSERAKLAAEINELKRQIQRLQVDLDAYDRILIRHSIGNTVDETTTNSGDSHLLNRSVGNAGVQKTKMVINRGVRLRDWILEAAKSIPSDFDRTVIYERVCKNHHDKATEIRKDSVGAILATLSNEADSGIIKVKGGIGKRGGNLYHFLK